MTRSTHRLRDVPWAGQVAVVQADALDPATLPGALEGVEVAYYLIHSIDTGGEFSDTDRRAAGNFAAAARAAGVQRIVYLGGMQQHGAEMSAHLASRAEVGDILLSSGVPTAVLQAAVVVGSGSASFEMLRYLTERLPAMVTPRWVHTRIQPIAIRDVLRYLVGCATLPADVNRRFDIAGPDVLTYVEMMRRYAAVAGLRRRWIVPVPVLTPRLSSHWVNLVTPVPGAIARPLVESLTTEVVAQERDIAQYVPDPPEGLIGFDESVRLALVKIRQADVETRWSDATWPGAPSDPFPTDPDWSGGSLYVDRREADVAAPPEQVWRIVSGIGGDRGWYSSRLLWQVRGLMDRLVGGVGLRRGRRDPGRLRVGESLDFWRVEDVEPGRLLRLRAEMRVPGLAWLEMTVEPRGASGSTYTQRALFHPRGLLGHLYWWSVAPFHGIVFGGMLRNIVSAAEQDTASRSTTAA
jgi:uncharacterized protein YbjT (DUF2867 family)/uncharacterized protein YndB with AHSA1/START domain